MTPGSDLTPTCRVCGRELDGVRVVELQLAGRVLRACAGACRSTHCAPGGRAPRPPPEARTHTAMQLKDLCADIDRASSRGEITFRDAVPMLLKLMREQCELLWVTDLSTGPCEVVTPTSS